MKKKVKLVKLSPDEDFKYRVDVNDLTESQIKTVLDNLMYFTDEVEDYDETGVSCWFDVLKNAKAEIRNLKSLSFLAFAK